MAFLTDYHCHTCISRDSQAPYYDMVMAEYNAGVRELCITDHCDTVDWYTMDFYPPCRDVAARELAAYEENRPRLPADLRLRMGVELGELHFHPELAGELTEKPWLDFVLGSYHITREYGDFFGLDYRDPAFCDTLWDVYLSNLQSLADMNFFDVLAHIGYFRRYAFQQGVDTGLTLAAHGDRLDTLFKTVIRNHRGIEINCSGLRDGCGPFPSPELLRRYRELGGEIITVGSDAHTVADAAKCLAEGQELLRSCGFRYVTVYTKRTPEFLPI